MTNAASPDPDPASPKPATPKVNDTWVDDAGELYVWNGTEWAPYEDVPFFDPDSVYRIEE